MARKLIIAPFIFIACLFVTACGDDDEPVEVTPIHFEKKDYTIEFGKGAVIPFTGGGGVYELTASNPEVLGRFGIEIEAPNHSLYVQPAKTGESYLTIKDVRAESTVTLHFTVEDFCLSFRIDEIEGKNTNEFFDVGRWIRFIRNEDNTKPVKVVRQQNMTSQLMTVGEGLFDIKRSDTNIFTMEFSLHDKENEEFALYEYVMSGDWEYMSMFDSIFDFGWEKLVVSSSKTQPVKTIKMILTDKANGCKITCLLEH